MHILIKKEKKHGYCFLIFILAVFLLQGCFANTEPKPVKPGTPCAFCKMPVAEMNYAAQIINTKGKVFAFDDLHCTTGFIHAKQISRKNIAEIYVADYTGSDMINIKNAFFLKSSGLKTPMNGQVAAFKTREDLNNIMQKYPGDVVTWNEIINK